MWFSSQSIIDKGSLKSQNNIRTNQKNPVTSFCESLRFPQNQVITRTHKKKCYFTCMAFITLSQYDWVQPTFYKYM